MTTFVKISPVFCHSIWNSNTYILPRKTSHFVIRIFFRVALNSAIWARALHMSDLLYRGTSTGHNLSKWPDLLKPWYTYLFVYHKHWYTRWFETGWWAPSSRRPAHRPLKRDAGLRACVPVTPAQTVPERTEPDCRTSISGAGTSRRGWQCLERNWAG